MGEDKGIANPEPRRFGKTEIISLVIIVMFIITIGLLLYILSLYGGLREEALSRNCSNFPFSNISFPISEIPPQVPSSQFP